MAVYSITCLLLVGYIACDRLLLVLRLAWSSTEIINTQEITIKSLLEAVLKGKLTRPEEQLEDLLTSSVFGSLKYVAPMEGLQSVLSEASNKDGSRPLRGLVISEAHYEFWPRLNNSGCKPCEPDALITIRDTDGDKIAILVESKYLAGKSTIPDEGIIPNDQLAREWDNLLIIANRERAMPIILYVTADFSYPSDDIYESEEEFRTKRDGLPPLSILWLSWRKLPNILGQSKHQLLHDVSAVLRKLGLIYYEGIKVAGFPGANWAYAEAPKVWAWDQITLPLPGWKFDVQKTFDWTILNNQLGWSYLK